MAKLIRFPRPADGSVYKEALRGIGELQIFPNVAPDTIPEDRVVGLVSTALAEGGIGFEDTPSAAPVLNAGVGLLPIPDLGVRVLPVVCLIVMGMATPIYQRGPVMVCLWRSTTDRIGSCGPDDTEGVCATLLEACLGEFIEHWKAANRVP